MSKKDLPIPVGTRVRFKQDDLGASERDDLGHTVEERFGAGDEGVVVFGHPNARNPCFNERFRRQLAQTVYVEVESRERPGHKLYVGSHVGHLEVVS